MIQPITDHIRTDAILKHLDIMDSQLDNLLDDIELEDWIKDFEYEVKFIESQIQLLRGD